MIALIRRDFNQYRSAELEALPKNKDPCVCGDV